MDRDELAEFLRSRRARLRPTDVGLPAGTRRRTPGLRREEVAGLAFISTEHYTRLEQARGANPSREVVRGLVRALRLSDAERDHLHHLAGLPPGPPPGPPREVRPSVLDLIARLPGAAIVVSATYEVLAWNDLAAALMEDFSAVPPRERNLARRAFLEPATAERRLYGVSDVATFGRAVARQLRATAARYPDAPEVAALIDDLLAGSTEFARLWDSHDVEPTPALVKTFRHPVIGPVTVNCDSLEVPETDQRLVIYTAPPGSPADEALRLLAVVGTQRLIEPDREDHPPG